MTAFSWAALAAALALVPALPRSSRRALALATAGRVAGPEDRSPPSRALRPGTVAAAGCAGAAAVTWWFGGAVLAAAATIAAATVARSVLLALRRRADERRDAGLLAALSAMAAELTAGATAPAAFEAAAQLAPGHTGVFARAAERCRAGESPELPDADLAGLAHAWRVAAETGAPIADVVARVAGHVADRIEQRRVVGSALAGARSSAALLAVLPLLGLALGAAIQADPIAVLVGSPAGRTLCLTGVALDAAGVLWTQRLARV